MAIVSNFKFLFACALVGAALGTAARMLNSSSTRKNAKEILDKRQSHTHTIEKPRSSRKTTKPRVSPQKKRQTSTTQHRLKEHKKGP
jgi:hypothetical protein